MKYQTNNLFVRAFLFAILALSGISSSAVVGNYDVDEGPQRPIKTKVQARSGGNRPSKGDEPKGNDMNFSGSRKKQERSMNNKPRKASGDEPYAIYEDGQLTFYCDDERESRSGESFDITDYSWPDWDNLSGSITRVVFTSSFASARPTTTSHWFDGFTSLTEIVGLQYLNTSEVTSMRYMFADCSKLTELDVSGFDTKNVTDMSWMFWKCSGLTYLDVSGFNTSNVTDMSGMFGCYKIDDDTGGHLTSLDVSGFNTRNVESMEAMFQCQEQLTYLDVSGFNTQNVTDMNWMFNKCFMLESLDVSHFNTSNVTSMKCMFHCCETLKSLDVSSFETSKVTTMNAMFWGGTNLKTLDVSHFNTSNVTDMSEMFCDCINLVSIDVSGFNTSKVTNMSSMFYNYTGNLQSLDVSHFDTSNVRDISGMFYGNRKLTTLDVSNFNTSKVTDMHGLFAYCSGLTSLDVSNFDTSNVKDMSEMFSNCASLTNIDVSGFNTSKVQDMSSMFSSCYALRNLALSHFDTSKVTDMEWMFDECNFTSLDLSSFNTSNVTNMKLMFWYCKKLETLFCSELWNTDKVTDSDDMFYRCEKLKGGMGTVFDMNHDDKEYARIDGGPSNPGYFTYAEVMENTCDLSDIETTSAYYASTAFLCERTVLSGSNPGGKTDVHEKLLRSHLAKIAFRGLYLTSGRRVPQMVVSDNFPTVYDDIADKTAANEYYYQPARALLYLEYGDGITPFDRNRMKFAPEETITRLHTLKVLMETFNIKPDVSGTGNPYPSDADVVSLASKDKLLMGYIREAARLGIITKENTTFRPNDDCLRGEAFIMLARIMRKIEAGEIEDPCPTEESYFQPLNTTPATIALGTGLPLGNFQHYTKTSFALNGTVPLTFSHTYNSYNTTLPEVFYGINRNGETYQPLGDGWSHNYHSFIVLPDGINGTDALLAVHWGGGNIEMYQKNGSRIEPLSYGVYDELSIEGSEIVIRTKNQMEYHFTGQGGSGGAFIVYLSSVKDRNGNTLTLNYETGVNDMKRIKSVSDGNRSLNFSYRPETNLLTTVSDPLGRNIKFDYSFNDKTQRFQLSSFTDAKSQKTTYIYGDNSKVSTSKLLEKIQLPKGNYIENQYDANHRLNKTVSGVNGVPTTETAVTVSANYSNGISTQSRIDVNRGSQTSSYNYSFNANNMVTNLSGPDGLSGTNTYGNSDHPQLPTAIENNSIKINKIKYDDWGNMTSLTVDGGEDGSLTTTMTYDEMNNLTSFTDPKGYKTTYSYDSKGNLTSVSAPEEVSTNISVNSKGLPIEMTSPMGVITEYEYNSYGNLTKSTLPALSLSSSATYDKASRLISLTDALNRTTSFEYDNNDNLIKKTDPANHTTKFAYDKNDNLTGITNAKGGVTSMSYDNATDWLTSVSFAGSTKNYEYNNDGTLSQLTKPDGTTRKYIYDDLGRITSDDVNTYNYDSKLRLQSISCNGKTVSFSYDGFNRITGTSCNGHSNSYSYDKNGNCTSINNTTYGYDKLNRMTSVSFNGKKINYTYRKDSQLSKVDYPNGMKTEFGYDEVGRLTSKETKLSNGTVIASYSYTLNEAGNITKQVAHEPFDEIFMDNEDTQYSYNDGNRIKMAGDISFSFDLNGNTTKRGSETYSWDIQDRLTRAGSVNIEYDPLGLIASYGDITFTTDPLGIGNVLSDSKSGAQYIYGNGLEARVKNGKACYYVTDVRGSVVAIVDESGNITHKYQYDEFGKVTQKEEADYNPFQYVGKYGVMYLTDHLYYMRARHYDPTIGRFFSEDPIWSTNLYPYADNNPVMGIDPSGKSYNPIYVDPNSDFKQLLVGKLPDYAIEYEGARELSYAIVIKGNNGESVQKKVTYKEYQDWYNSQSKPKYQQEEVKTIYVGNAKPSNNKGSKPNINTQVSGSPTVYNQNSGIANSSNIHGGIDYGNLNTKSIEGMNPIGDYEIYLFNQLPDEAKDKLADIVLGYVGISASGLRNAANTAKKIIGVN